MGALRPNTPPLGPRAVYWDVNAPTLRGRDEQRQMKFGDISVQKDQDGRDSIIPASAPLTLDVMSYHIVHPW